MILVDLQQVMLATLLVSLDKHTNAKIEESMLRHMVLNSIRANRKKFHFHYGDMIICCDSHGNSWRKKLYPFYKANRKKEREKIDLNWPMVFESLNRIKSELKEFFPYPVVEVSGAEADDIIATLVLDVLTEDEPKLILSRDKDFIQLHNPQTKQYDPIKKKYIQHDDPKQYLLEHILKGDLGDGIPNVLSDDDSLVIGSKRPKLTSKRMTELLSTPVGKYQDINIINNYKRNEALISLYNIPTDIQDEVGFEYSKQKGKDRSKLMSYFMNNKLKNLMEDIADF